VAEKLNAEKAEATVAEVSSDPSVSRENVSQEGQVQEPVPDYEFREAPNGVFRDPLICHAFSLVEGIASKIAS
jgi:hypothetical protein